MPPSIFVEHGKLNAKLSAKEKVNAKLSAKGIVNGTVQLPETVDVDTYDGNYIVSPAFEEQTLSTSHKYLIDDVTVEAIEVARTSNPAGGNTVYIGGII